MERISKWTLTLVACSLLLSTSAHCSIVVSSALVTAATNIKPAGQIPNSAFENTALSGHFISHPSNYTHGAYLPSFDISDPASGIRFTVTEGAFDTINGLPNDLSLFNTSGSKLKLESQNVNQNDVGSASWGFDTESPINTSTNAAFIFNFTTSPVGVYQFGADLIDFEGGNGRDAYVGVYNQQNELLYAESFAFPNTSKANVGYGNREVRFIGVESTGTTPIGSIVFVAGDDSEGTGGTERIAIGDLYAAAQPIVATPIPAGLWLFASGCIVTFRYHASRREKKDQPV